MNCLLFRSVSIRLEKTPVLDPVSVGDPKNEIKIQKRSSTVIGQFVYYERINYKKGVVV